MKTIHSNIYGLKQSARFNKKVSSLLPKKTRQIWLYDFGFGRSSGYGHYKMTLLFYLDGNIEQLSTCEYTTCAPLFDEYGDMEGVKLSNFLKNKVIDLLSNDETIEKIDNFYSED